MNLIMLTDYRGFFRQQLGRWESLDKNKMLEIFNKNDISVKEYNFEEVINSNIELKNKIIIYTSSQDLEYKKYIDDVLYYLSKNNILIPRYDIFKAHENKGYQEILKKEFGIKSLDNYYLGNLAGVDLLDKDKLNFPLILKKNEGAGSSNVYKVSTKNKLIQLIKKINKPSNYNIFTLKKYLKKYIFKNKYKKEYYKEDIFSGEFILQEFMAGLDDDWKILIFGNKYYFLNRKTRNNDFRASGSGKFSYIDPPKEVLEYANEIFKKLDVPFISLDVGYNGEECNLIEFQGVHFGPYTLINSPWYYEYNNGEWTKINEKSNLEQEYANSYVKYINKVIE